MIDLILISLVVSIFLIFNKGKPNIILKNDKRKIQIYSDLYIKLNMIPFVGNSLMQLKARLYIKKNEEELILRAKAVTIYITSFILSVLVYILLLRFYSTDFYTACILLVSCLFIKNIIINNFVGTDLNLLKLFKDFITEIKHNYDKYGRVDTAIYEASCTSNYDIAIHGMKIYEALKNGATSLNNYINDCPNRFLKLLANLSYLTKEFGDKKQNDVSYYIENLNYLMEQAQIEYKRKDALKYWLSAGTIFTLIPLIYPKFLQQWVSSNFPDINYFYNSSIGYCCKILILFCCFTCYILVKKFQSDEDEKINEILLRDKYWEEDLLNNKNIKHIVDIFSSKTSEKKYKDIEKLIEDSGCNLKVEWVSLRKIIAFLASFIILLGFFAAMHKVNISRIKNDAQYGNSNSYNLMLDDTNKENSDPNAVNNFDNNIITEVNKIPTNNVEQLKNKVRSYVSSSISDNNQIKEYTNRITLKILDIENENIHIYEILIAIILSFIFSNIPIWILYFQKYLRKKNMMYEVFQFDTIIIMLMSHDRVSVRMILEWMERYSDVFKNPIKNCLSIYSKGHVNALLELKNSVKFQPFCRIIDNLIAAEDSIQIKKAFSSLKLEREFNKQEREEVNKRQIEDRVYIGRLLSMTPSVVAICLYLACPIIIYTINVFLKMYSQFQSF